MPQNRQNQMPLQGLHNGAKYFRDPITRIELHGVRSSVPPFN
jgi:hypothetical protein